MIGAGIFALFGQISTLAGGYAWLAFLVSAVISGLAGYSYFVLAKSADSNGGLLLFFAYHLIGAHNLELYVFAGVVIFAIVFCAASQKLVVRFDMNGCAANPVPWRQP